MIVRWWFFMKTLSTKIVSATKLFPYLHRLRLAARFALLMSQFSCPVIFTCFRSFSLLTTMYYALSCPWMDAVPSKWSKADIPLTKHRISLSTFSSLIVMEMRKLEYLYRVKNCQPVKSIDDSHYEHIQSRLFWWLSPSQLKYFMAWGLDELHLLRSWQWKLGLFAWIFWGFNRLRCFSSSCNNWRDLLLRSIPWRFGAFSSTRRIRINRF